MADTKKTAKKAADKPAQAEAKQSGAAAKKGDKVKIDYVGTFDDGKIFDASTKHGKPIEFEVGSGMVIPGFDNGVVGMKVGEEKTIKIEPKDGYGEVREELVKVITRDSLPKEKEPEVGMVLLMGLSNGIEVPARISKVNGNLVTLDLNHPLAGKTLNFKIKLVGIE